MPRVARTSGPTPPNAAGLAQAAVGRALAAIAKRTPPAYHKPITIADRAAAASRVSHYQVDVLAPQLVGGDRRVAVYHGSSSEDAAARRAGLAGGISWGPDVWVVAAYLLPGNDDVQYALLHGQLSAVRQALPDQRTLLDAADAGARYWPRPDGAYPSGMPRCKYGPLAEALKPIQVEYETRGITHETAIAAQ